MSAIDTRNDLMSRLNDLFDNVQDALVDNARVKLQRSREHMREWEDWMFPLPPLGEGALYPLEYVLGDVTVYEPRWEPNVEGGRPWENVDHADECYMQGSTIRITCQESQLKIALVHEVYRAEDYASSEGWSCTTRWFKFMGKYGTKPMSDASKVFGAWTYELVERRHADRTPCERECDHEGVYV